jgi:hypothetical protein
MATSVFCIAMLLALIGFDVYLASDRIDDNTYSERIRKLWGPLRFVVAFALGGLCIHFWGWEP